MRYYTWMREPKYQKWTEISSKKFAAAIKAGDTKLAMRIAALWQGKIILDPRYGNIEDMNLELLARKIKVGA